MSSGLRDGATLIRNGRSCHFTVGPEHVLGVSRHVCQLKITIDFPPRTVCSNTGDILYNKIGTGVA